MIDVVVTGATGFIGRHLVYCLSEIPGVRVTPVARRKMPGGYQVNDYTEVPEGNILIHLAEDSDRASVERHGRAYKDGAKAVIDAIQANPYKAILYVSSAVLYGDRERAARKETDPVVISDVYTETKYENERKILAKDNGVVARLSNVYGPGMSRSNVISRVIGQLASDGPIEIYDSSPTRDFLHVNDAAQGIISLALHRYFNAGPASIYNIGTSVGTSVLDLVRLCLEASGQPSRSVSSSHIGEPSCVVVDNKKITNACGWSPEIDLDRGLFPLVTSESTR